MPAATEEESRPLSGRFHRLRSVSALAGGVDQQPLAISRNSSTSNLMETKSQIVASATEFDSVPAQRPALAAAAPMVVRRSPLAPAPPAYMYAASDEEEDTSQIRTVGSISLSGSSGEALGSGEVSHAVTYGVRSTPTQLQPMRPPQEQWREPSQSSFADESYLVGPADTRSAPTAAVAKAQPSSKAKKSIVSAPAESATASGGARAAYRSSAVSFMSTASVTSKQQRSAGAAATAGAPTRQPQRVDVSVSSLPREMRMLGFVLFAFIWSKTPFSYSFVRICVQCGCLYRWRILRRSRSCCCSQ